MLLNATLCLLCWDDVNDMAGAVALLTIQDEMLMMKLIMVIKYVFMYAFAVSWNVSEMFSILQYRKY